MLVMFMVIDGRYIIVFHSETPVQAVKDEMSRLEAKGATISHFYDGSAILGFAAAIPDDQLSKHVPFMLVTLTSNGQIKYVEADGEVSAYAQKLLSL